MSDASLRVDIIALILLILYGGAFTLLWCWRKQFSDPYIFFSNVKSLGVGQGRARWISLPSLLMWISLAAFGCAFVDPHVFTSRHLQHASQPPPSHGIAIYLVLDNSGSMNEEVTVQSGKKGLYTTSKIDLLKKVSREFIEGDPQLGLSGRSNDMIGLIFFARGAHVMAPLTLDHETLLQELDKFHVIGDKDQDGTSIGYALYKTANMIAATRHYAQALIEKGEPAYTIKNSVIILITDGLQDPNPLDKGKRFRNMDVPEAATYIKEQGIRLYIVNVEPRMNTKEFEPYQHIMQRATALTGGQFFAVDLSKGLEQIYKEIDQLETSVLHETSIDKGQHPDLYQRISVYPYIVLLGLLSFLVAVILDTLILRRVP